MILISHRGNISSINEQEENSPNYIIRAISLGYHVEIDLFKIDDNLYLGHDKPTHKIDPFFLDNEKLFVHCKNKEALLYMSKAFFKSDFFWHQNDNYTLTSKNKIWTFTGEELIHGSICVMPENHSYSDLSMCYGICSDVIEKYKTMVLN
jgi:hypothetical protein